MHANQILVIMGNYQTEERLPGWAAAFFFMRSTTMWLWKDAAGLLHKPLAHSQCLCFLGGYSSSTIFVLPGTSPLCPTTRCQCSSSTWLWRRRKNWPYPADISLAKTDKLTMNLNSRTKCEQIFQISHPVTIYENQSFFCEFESFPPAFEFTHGAVEISWKLESVRLILGLHRGP